MTTNQNCCFGPLLLTTMILLILTIVETIQYIEYKNGISSETCNITSASYPKHGEDNNFYKCKCGKRCYSFVGICNKIFMDETLVMKNFNKPVYLNSIDLKNDNKICSSYENTKCITDFAELYNIVETNSNNVKQLVNTTIPCFKKDNVYFLHNQTNQKNKNSVLMLITFCIFFFITLVNFCINYNLGN